MTGSGVLCERCAERDVSPLDDVPAWLRGLVLIIETCVPCAEAFAEAWARSYILEDEKP